MAKAQRVVVPEPTDSLLMAVPKPKQPDTVYIVTTQYSSIKVGGVDTPLVQPKDGIVGYMLVFDDYEKALSWADGDIRKVLVGRSS